MADSDPLRRFYQFPLCLLQRNRDDPRDLCADIVAWTLVDKGRSVIEGEDYFVDRTEIPRDADPAKDAHFEIVVMAQKMMLPLDVGDLDAYAERHEEVRAQVDQYLEEVEGGDMEVRVRHDIVEHVRDGRMPVRSFNVLCGLYAAIGAHRYRRISLRHLRYLSAGFKSEAAYRAAGGDHTLLTKRQVQYTRDQLLDTRWLFRYHDGRRNYYSHRLNNEEIADAVSGDKAARKKRQIAEKKAQLTRKRKLDALDAELAALDAELREKDIRGDGQLPVVQPSDPEGRKGR